MAYKVYLWDSLDAIGWSQAAWRVDDGASTAPEACDWEMIRAVMLRVLPRDGLVLDAGCGTARWPIYLRRLGYRCVGIEIALAGCRKARAFDAAMPVACGDTTRAPIRSGAADAILSLGVVEHDEAGPAAGLRELHRLLRPGGVLVLAVPFDNLWRRLVMNHLQTWITRRRRRRGMRLGFAEYRFSRREVAAFLRAAGFEPMSAHPNDLLPPRVGGLWVDLQALILDPFSHPDPWPLFIVPGWRGRLARAAVRLAPWLVAGEVVVVAHKPSTPPRTAPAMRAGAPMTP